MNTEAIQSRIIKTELVPWETLLFIQDEDFKEWINDGDEKLLQSIVKYQFIDPFKVWQKGKKLYCLDGKHRWKDLTKAKEMGIVVPEKLPATFIDCTDIKEAAELVLIYSSAYARITEQGLFNFTDKFKLDLTEMSRMIQVPDIDLTKFMGDLARDYSDNNSELSIDSFANEIILKLIYPKEEYINIKQLIDAGLKHHNLKEPEDLIKKLLLDECSAF